MANEPLVAATDLSPAAGSSASLAPTGAAASATPFWESYLSTASIKSDMAAADVNGVVTAQGLTTLLTDLDGTLSSSTLTSAEFADLQTIAANLNNGLSTSSYLTYVFNALVNGNPANATWTGGGASSWVLGPLGTGASQTQLGELIDKWFLGTDLPSSYVDLSGSTPFTVSYKTVNSPLFAGSGPTMNDVNQRELGDCYFLAPCAEIACMNPSYIESMFSNNGNGTYGVRFYYDGAPEYVTVNLELANGGGIFNITPTPATPGYIWASLAEKAWAQFQAINCDTGNSWSSINGGLASNALEALTGASTITEYDAGGSSWYDGTFNSSMSWTYLGANLSTQTVATAIAADLANHDDVVVGSNKGATDPSNGDQTLVEGHEFSILSCDSNTEMVELRNPWGTQADYGGAPFETTFEISLSTQQADGDTIDLDNVGGASALPNPATMAQYLNNISAYDEFVSGVVISDKAAAVAAGFDQLNADSDIKSITLTDTGTPTLTLTLAQAADDTTALGKITNANYVVAISGAAASVQANLAALIADAGHIKSVTLTDTSPATLSYTVRGTDGANLSALLGKFQPNADVTLALSGAAANLEADYRAGLTGTLLSGLRLAGVTVTASSVGTADVATLVADFGTLLQPMAVSDTAANVQNNLGTLGADTSHIDSITASNGTVTTNVATFEADAAVLNKIVGGFAISDTAANVQDNLTALEGDASYIDSITPSNGPITTSVATFEADKTALNKVIGGFAIYDTAAHVEAGLAALEGDESHIVSITATGGVVTVDNDQFLADKAALNKIVAGFDIQGRASVLQGDLGNLAADTSHVDAITASNGTITTNVATLEADKATLNKIVDGFAISDTAVNVEAGLAALEGDASHIVSITATGGQVTTSVATFEADLTALNEVVGGFAISDTAASDTAANVLAGLAPLAAADASHITSITATGGQVTVSDGLFVADETTLNKIVDGFSILAEASVLQGDLNGLEADISHINSITAAYDGPITTDVATFKADEAILNKIVEGFAISDTAANVQANLAALEDDASHIVSITASNGTITTNVATFDADEAALNEIVGGFDIQGRASALQGDLGRLAADTSHIDSITASKGTITTDVATFKADETTLNKIVGGFAISDTAANVQANLAALEDDASHINSIAATGGVVSVSVATLNADETMLNKIVGGFAISDTAANVLADFSAIKGDHHVTGVSIADTAADIEALTAAQIASLAGCGVTRIAASASVSLTVAQAAALESGGITVSAPSGDFVTLSDTAANIAAITQAQANALKAAGYTSIASTDGAVTLSFAEAQMLSGDGLKVTGAAAIVDAYNAAGTLLSTMTSAMAATLTAEGYALGALDTAAHIEKLTAAGIAKLSGLDVKQIAASDTNVALSEAQAIALESADIAVAAPSGDKVSLSDTAAIIERLTVGQIALLPTIGVTAVAATDDSVTLTVDQAAALETAGVEVTAPSGKTVTLSDKATDIETELTAGQITLLPTIGVTAVAATDASVTLTVDQAAALETAKLAVSAPSGKTVTLSDTALDIETELTANDIAGLEAIGVTALASSASTTLTIAQAVALQGAGLKLSVPTNDAVTLADTAADIDALTATQIAALKAMKFTAIAATNASVLLTVAQATALETAGVKVTVPLGKTVTLSDTAAQIETLTGPEISSLAAIGVTAISASGSVSLTAAQATALEAAPLKVSVPPGDSVTLPQTAAQIVGLTAAEISSLAAIGVTTLAANASVLLTAAQVAALETAKLKVSVPSGDSVTLSDTAAQIETLTAAEISTLAAIGVTTLAANASVLLTVAEPAELETAKLKVSAPSGKTVTLSDTALDIETDLTPKEIAGLKAIGVTGIAATDASVTLTVDQAAALETAKLAVSAPSGKTVTLSDTATNIETELTAKEIAGLKASGITGIAATGASLVLNAADAAAIETAGLKVSAPSGDTVSVSDTAANVAAYQSQLAALAASGEIAWIEQLNPNGSRTFSSIENGTTIAGTGTDDTFVFTPAFGHDVIANFTATGTSHDVLEFSASSFSYMTPGESQAAEKADWAALLLHGVTSTAAGAMITDSKGDTLTLEGVTKSTLALAANAGDFKFV